MKSKAVFRKSTFVKLIRTIFSVGVACVLSFNESVAQDNFCMVLQSVTAAASSDNNLDGLKSQKRTFLKNQWYANRDIPGFKDCTISDRGAPYRRYTCILEMNSPEAAKAKVHEMDAAIRACLPQFTRSVNTVHEAPSFLVFYNLSLSNKRSVEVNMTYRADSEDRFVVLGVKQSILQ